jgi:cytochrome c oxidase assembly protein Cox11
MSAQVRTLVSRKDRRAENRRVVLVLIGVMVLLVAVSVATVLIKH